MPANRRLKSLEDRGRSWRTSRQPSDNDPFLRSVAVLEHAIKNRDLAAATAALGRVDIDAIISRANRHECRRAADILNNVIPRFEALIGDDDVDTD